MGVTSNRTFSAAAKGFPPLTTGKTFFVSDTTGAYWNELNLAYTPDVDGVARVYTSITLALAQCTAGRGDYIGMATDFTTALTAAEILSAETKGVTVVPLGRNLDGTYFCERLTATLPQAANSAIFTVNGKVLLRSIRGTVTTGIQNQACTAQLNHQQSEGYTSLTNIASTALCAASSIASDAIGTVYSITGTFANALVTSASAGLYQAASVMLRPGSIKLQTSASNTGSVKWRVDYEPLEPGAQVVSA